MGAREADLFGALGLMAATSKGWEKRRPKTIELYIKGKITKKNGCWLWPGAKGRPGSFSYKNKNGIAPRMVYRALVGPIRADLCILHKCDDPRCVNPKHLRQGTKRENRADFMKRHPKARVILAKSIAKATNGVRLFWKKISPAQKRKFIKGRVEKQKKKYPNWAKMLSGAYK
jgi:hypothetical protein